MLAPIISSLDEIYCIYDGARRPRLLYDYWLTGTVAELVTSYEPVAMKGPWLIQKTLDLVICQIYFSN